MPELNWNDLRYLLAVRRGGSLVSAARLLRVDDTTVARRLKALAAAFGEELVRREADGRLALTARGEAVALRADQVDRELSAITTETATPHDGPAGTVRLTSVPIIVNRVLAPAAAKLLADNPALVLELIPDSRDFSLTRREADMALRLGRPKAGGSQVKARRLATLAFAVYASATLESQHATSLPWVSYEDAMAHLPQARWMAKAAGGDGGRVSALKVHDAETALEAVVAGLGRTLLPVIIADRDRRLRRVGDDETALTRELWLIVHADLAKLPRIAAVTSWIEAVIADRALL